jgi:ABC-type multidrug transport system permease subunit
VLIASSITYLEALLASHLSYAQAMASLAALVLVGGAIVIAMGPESHRAEFGRTRAG